MMAYVRAKKKGNVNYYYVVEGSRDHEGKVKQKILLYMGNVNHILKVFEFYKENN